MSGRSVLVLLCGQASAGPCEGDERASCETECQEGKAGKCHALGELLWDESLQDAAIAHFVKGCEGDYAWSCYQLGAKRPARYRELS